MPSNINNAIPSNMNSVSYDAGLCDAPVDVETPTVLREPIRTSGTFAVELPRRVRYPVLYGNGEDTPIKLGDLSLTLKDATDIADALTRAVGALTFLGGAV